MAFTRIGYGQVEPNQLSGIKTGQIYASLPLDAREDSKVDVLQNGEFMYYDYASNCVTAEPHTATAGVLEPYLVYNEVKLYEDWLSYKDFAMIRVGNNYVTSAPMIGRLTSANADGTVYGDGSLNTSTTPYPDHTEYDYRMDGIAPRLVKTNVGDIYTTNMINANRDELKVGDVLTPGAKGILEVAEGDMKWQVVKVYTMPDHQKGVKIMRIA